MTEITLLTKLTLSTAITADKPPTIPLHSFAVLANLRLLSEAEQAPPSANRRVASQALENPTGLLTKAKLLLASAKSQVKRFCSRVPCKSKSCSCLQIEGLRTNPQGCKPYGLLRFAEQASKRRFVEACFGKHSGMLKKQARVLVSNANQSASLVLYTRTL